MNDHELAAMVRRADPDRFLGTLFAAPAVRRDLLILYAFNHELARAREVASTPPLALIRLQWWREVVEGAARDHPVATLVRGALDRGIYAPAELVALIDAREAEADDIPDLVAFMRYIRGTAGGLMRVAGQALGVSEPAGLSAIEDVGTGTGIAFLLRAAAALRAVGRDLLPQDGTPHAALIDAAQALLAAPSPRAALPATIPAVLARRDLVRLRRGVAGGPRGTGDRLAVIAAGLFTKRV